MSGKTILSRRDARAQGLLKFFTGRPCKYGHISERYVISWGCVDCMRKAGSETSVEVRLEFARPMAPPGVRLLQEFLHANRAAIQDHIERRIAATRYLAMVTGTREEFEAQGLSPEAMVLAGVAVWRDL